MFTGKGVFIFEDEDAGVEILQNYDKWEATNLIHLFVRSNIFKDNLIGIYEIENNA